jgi:hypothetical protein
MKYEYKTESGFSFDDMERRLNEEGFDSWELVSTIGWGTKSFTAIFKRAIRNNELSPLEQLVSKFAGAVSSEQFLKAASSGSLKMNTEQWKLFIDIFEKLKEREEERP